MRSRSSFALMFILFLAAACTVMKQENSEESIREFTAEFEKRLQQDDASILALFNTPQTREELLSAIRVMQNRGELGVKCHANFPAASIITSEAGTFGIHINAQLSVDTLEVVQTEDAAFTLWMGHINNDLVVTRLEAEDFYSRYVQLKNNVGYASEEKALADHHLKFIETAQRLQETYDTVVWVTQYDNKDYYYVVNGTWTEERKSEFAMGLVDKDGKVIVPVEFDLVGTIGFDLQDVVEVYKGQGTGYYNLNGSRMIEAEYQYIVPYDQEGSNIVALVKTDSTFGWIDRATRYHAGFPSPQAKKYALNLEYLPSDLHLNSESQTLCEVPSADYNGFGSGILMPPSYLRDYFNPVMSGFTTASSSYRGNISSISASRSFMEGVMDKISLLMITIKENYLDGRTGFYEHRQVSFVDGEGTLTSTGVDIISSEVSFRQIDSTLYELKAENLVSDWDYFGEGGPSDEHVDETEINRPQYVYYRIVEGQLQQESSNRQFPYTEFVKLDNSYIKGPFRYYSNEIKDISSRDMLSETTITEMRNEILASYGYAFPDEEIRGHFTYFKWYSPTRESREEVESLLSDIDRHNLAFLEALIGQTAKGPA